MVVAELVTGWMQLVYLVVVVVVVFGNYNHMNLLNSHSLHSYAGERAEADRPFFLFLALNSLAQRVSLSLFI